MARTYGRTILPQRKFLVYATQLYHEKRYHNTLTVLKRLWKRCESAADRRAVLFFAALSYSRMGDRHTAIAVYQDLLKADPHHSVAWSNLGEQFRQEGFYKDAINSFEEAIRSDGNNAIAHSNLAAVYVHLGSFQNVITYATRALELNPYYYHAATDLAMAYYALGDREQPEHYSQLALLNDESEENLKEALLSVRGIDLDEIDALEDPEESVEE